MLAILILIASRVCLSFFAGFINDSGVIHQDFCSLLAVKLFLQCAIVNYMLFDDTRIRKVVSKATGEGGCWRTNVHFRGF